MRCEWMCTFALAVLVNAEMPSAVKRGKKQQGSLPCNWPAEEEAERVSF